MCWIITVQMLFCLDHAWHEWGTRLPSHNLSSRSIVKGFVLFTHFCDCTVKTELIYRSNCAKNCFNRFLVGTLVYRQFSTTFAFKHSSEQWTRSTENWVSAFCKFYHHLLRNSVPFSLWLYSWLEDHFFSDPGPRSDHFAGENLLA